jgi:AcrR family transcriptional regulator
VVSILTTLSDAAETLERAIFDAVLNELCEGGYEAVTMERVAARAHKCGLTYHSTSSPRSDRP